LIGIGTTGCAKNVKKTNPKELTKENCINDWVILNKAWESTP
jgi:hypothetical protein